MNDICLVQNSLKTTYLFRKDYISRLVMEGRRVVVIAPLDCEESARKLRALNCEVIAPRKLTRKENLLFNVIALNWQIAKFRLVNRNATYVCFFLTTFIFTFPTLSLVKSRLLLSVEGLGSFFSKHSVAKGILKFLIKNFTTIRIFCNSDERDQVGQATDIVTNGIGINLERFEKVHRKSSDELILIYVGRLITDKGIRDAFETLDRAITQGLNIKLKIVGDYYPNNPTSLDEQDIARAKNKFGEHIEFLGFVEQIENIYAASDILILPSIREGFPVCVMEASAVGIPTLAYRVPGCVDAVKHGVNGYLSDYGDIESMVTYLKLIHDDKNLLAQLSESSKIYAEQNFDIQQKITQFISLINKLEHIA